MFSDRASLFFFKSWWWLGNWETLSPNEKRPSYSKKVAASNSGSPRPWGIHKFNLNQLDFCLRPQEPTSTVGIKPGGKGRDAHSPTWVFSTSSRPPLMFSLGSYALNIKTEAWFGIAATLRMATDPSAFHFLPLLYPSKRPHKQLGSSDFVWGRGGFPKQPGFGDWGRRKNGAMMWKWGMVTDGWMDFFWGVQNCPRINSPWVGRNWMHFGFRSKMDFPQSCVAFSSDCGVYLLYRLLTLGIGLIVLPRFFGTLGFLRNG